MSAHGGGDPKKVIRAALYANLGIAACKLVAAYLSKSTSTLAEAVHSIADTGNQALLFTGIVLSQKSDTRHAFGRAAERYFWPFIVALLLFSVGGTFALYEGIHRMITPEAPDLSELWSLRHGPLTSLVVLGVSAVMEGYSCSVALREFRRESGKKPLAEAVFEVKDPTIPLVLLEDISALCGLSLAFVAVVLTAVTGNGRWDALGSILIGVLLMVVAVLIARDTHSLLLGERATPEMEQRAQVLAEGAPGVVRVTQLLTMHMGPEFVVLAMKVAFTPELKVGQVEEVINEVERRIRGELPFMKKIFTRAGLARGRTWRPTSGGPEGGFPKPLRVFLMSAKAGVTLARVTGVLVALAVLTSFLPARGTLEAGRGPLARYRIGSCSTSAVGATRAFNDAAWEGLSRARDELGVTTEILVARGLRGVAKPRCASSQPEASTS